MSGYTVEIRTGIITDDNILHTWLQITRPDGTKEAWGLYPKEDSLGNIIYGPGKIKSEAIDKPYTSTSGPLSMTPDQYNQLMNNIAEMVANPPNYSSFTFFGGVQCSAWAVTALHQIDLIPSVISPDTVPPELIPIVQTIFWNPLWQTAGFLISDLISTVYTAAQASIPRRDPLTIDLDGDGIETIPASATNPILFDHDGDGVKTGTGWVGPDDGFLVLDRNGNGVIDNGTELFGDSTPLYAGGKAADGFAALSQEDTNGDGRVDSLDANWAKLKVWRDLNQDGISQTQELFTMEKAGIASFNVSSIANSQTLPNGNQIADLGVYTKTDGSTGTMGEVGRMADVNLADDTFHREFPDYIPPAEGVESLPEMKGSGKVRDLHEAASQSASLKDLLTQYSQATTRQAQTALLDQLLDAWADTSGMSETLDDRDPEQYRVRYDSFGAVRRSNYVIGQEGDGYVRDVDNENLTLEYRELIAQWNRKIHILEAFNGRFFFTLPDETQAGFSAVVGLTLEESGGGAGTLVVNYTQDQLNLLTQSYEALRESVYSALLSQTRFKLPMDLIGVVIENSSIGYDFSEVEQYFQDLITQNAAEGMGDLIEFNRYTGSHLSNFGWKGNERMLGYICSLPVTPALETVYAEFAVLIAGRPGFTDRDSAKSEIIIAGNDGGSIYGNGGNDLIAGGTGTDSLYGGQGSDTLDGGAGNDYLQGGQGDDVYIFGRGSGSDTLFNYEVNGHGTDTVRFGEGLTADSLDYLGDADYARGDLIIRIRDTGETLTIKNGTQGASCQVEQFRFENGSVLKAVDLTLTIEGTAGSDILTARDGFQTILHGGDGTDTIRGANRNDVLLGGSGADVLSGCGGSDTLHGGDGNDTLYGNDGNDVLFGGAGSDTLSADAGDDTLDGGPGDDSLLGGMGDDVFLFGRGSGSDTLNNYYNTSGHGTDTIQFGEGLTADSLDYLGDSNYSRGNLIFRIRETGETLALNNGARGGALYQVEKFRFSDGSELTAADLTLTVEGTAGGDTLTGYDSFRNVVAGGDGNDTLYGGSREDVLLGGAGADVLSGYGGSDTLEGGEGDDKFYGYDGSDGLFGGAGSDTLDGGAGDDTLDGGAGSDSLQGGAGNDIYLFSRGSGSDTLNNYYNTSGHGTDTIQFGEGLTADSLDYLGDSNYSRGNIIFRIRETGDILAIHYGARGGALYQVEQFRFEDGSVLRTADLTLTVEGTAGGDTLTGYDGFRNAVAGGEGNDALRGANLNDVILGGAGDDSLNGYAGDDTLDGGEGSDTMAGGTGNDTYIVEGAGDVVTENSGAGTDTVRSSITYVLGSNIENLTLEGESGINGTGNALNNILTGNSADNALDGGSGDDTLDGVEGSDTMAGGTGNDTYIVDSAGDVVTESASGGIDTVQSSISYTLGNNVENLTLLGESSINGTGNALNNILTGNSADNALDGGEGNDTLEGGPGNDVYVFGSAFGNDIVQETGGDSADKVVFRENLPGDITPSRDGSDLLLASAGGTDTVLLKNWYTDAAGRTETVVFKDGTVWDENQIRLMTNLAPTVIDPIGDQSAAEDAAFNFIVPADTFSDPDVEVGDTLTYSAALADGTSLPEWLSFDPATRTFSGTPDNGNVGSLSLQVTATDTSGASASSLFTLTVVNTNDAPVVSNPIGDQSATEDTAFNFIVPADTFSDADAGDTLSYSATFSDGTALPEWLSFDPVTRIFSGTPSFNDAGTLYIQVTATDKEGAGISSTFALNVQQTSIVGTSDDDILTGTESADKIYGLAGGDMLCGFDGSDTLYGGAGSDILDGGWGADSLIGGAGSDLYIVDEEGDVVTENTGEGTDVVYSSVSYTLSANVERLILMGAAIDGTGNDLANLISGTGSNNVLDGLDGSDTLYGYNGGDTLSGGGGSDMLIGGKGSDTYVFSQVDGKDVITDVGLAGDEDVVRMTDVLREEPVIVKQDNDLYLFVDIENYIKVTNQLNPSNPNSDGIERLEVSDGCYITRSDIMNIVNTMSAINNDPGMDVLQKYNAMLNDPLYAATLAQSWQQA